MYESSTKRQQFTSRKKNYLSDLKNLLLYTIYIYYLPIQFNSISVKNSTYNYFER